MDSTNRKHVRQFPIKRIEALVKVAVENNLSLLQIGDIKIVPSGSSGIVQASLPKILEEAERRVGRPLSDTEKRDELLFGPGGSIQVVDE